MSKCLYPNIQPEKQNIKPLKGNEISQERPHIGHGRAGMRRPSPINQTITQTSELSNKNLEVPKIESRITIQPNSAATTQSITNSNDLVTHRRPMINDIPLYPDPNYRPPPKPIRTPTPGSSQSTDINPEINIDFKENSLLQEGVISEIYQRTGR